MSKLSPSAENRPELAELGKDLLETTCFQRWLALSRPFFCVVIYALLAWFGLWWLTLPCVFLIFVSVVNVTHDVVHGSLGLGKKGTEWALFATGAMLLESGHAYRASHLQHHAVFPSGDDPEGDPARMTFLGAILHGPIFLPRLWWWAFRHASKRPGQRAWLLLEASLPLACVGTGLAIWPQTSSVLFYALQVILGSWVYPLLTVYLPHHHYGDTPWTQTRTLRGRIIPALFLELTYHLEHHLYPAVPAHHLAELSRRLEPDLRRAGVAPRRVP